MDLMLTPIRMTSREIAELVEKRHDNVKRTIETLVERNIILKPQIDFLEEINNLGLPIKREVYVFPSERKSDTYVVVTKLAPQFTAKVVDAWGRTENTLTELLKAFEAFDVPAELGELYIYAIRECDTGNIKLGISSDPHKRVAQLQTGNSSRLELVAYRRAMDHFRDERLLHERAEQYHIRGEWFNANALGVVQ